MFIHNGCVEHLEETIYLPSDNVSFRTSLIGSNASVSTKGFSDCLTFEEEEWTLETYAQKSTKAGLYNSLNGLKAGVYGYVYSGDWNADKSPIDGIAGAEYTFDGDQLDAVSPVRWTAVENASTGATKFRAFVYAPLTDVTPVYQTPAEGDNKAKGAPVIKVPDIWKIENGKYVYQKDILVADATVTLDAESKSHRKEIPLDFQHIYTAIQFKAGFECTITGVTISGIKTAGDYVIGSGWEYADGNGSLSYTLPEGGLSVEKGDNIGEQILMIPHKMVSGAKMTLSYTDTEGSKTIDADLNGVEWRQGKKITYTLMRESDREFIYFDLAAGNVTIAGKNYEGYVFVNSEAKLVKGKIKEGQKYYVYQSCAADINKESPNYKRGFTTYTDNGDNDKSAGGTFTKPVYNPVTLSDGTLWSDYITNNPSVEAVIEAWDDADGAKNNSTTDLTRAVRKAGREATKKKIHVSGDIDDCTIIIDNIYSSYHGTQGANRSEGSITFNPTANSGSKLHLHLIGDNRLGCIQYDNRSKDIQNDNVNNYLVIEGEGSLTVADADFYKANGTWNSTHEKTYYSNHYDSAIGNADNKDNCYGIVINSGTLFAGTTIAENCTAIGGGGNGVGEVIINGGVVTAVASTTGTAIGGGIGFSANGGVGYVTINGGNIYAYNHANPDSIPSSAIGGAGSSAATGASGTVVINGGNVYAESGLGTAIGGGSSKTQPGGQGIVTITGGTVIAKSLSSISAGIGGGSTCTGGGSLTNPNGGNAIITIGVENDPTKRPIIRTGSIGGGGTNATGGTVGGATVKVYGGDIQAQFVMAQSAAQNSFLMEDGLIRNSSTSDSEYHCIKENGAAVYMEKGSFTMKGGEIRACSADKTATAKGGAVYIKGDVNTSFTMSGGEIRECMAKADGGAVYLEGGTVTINGGTIEGNVAYNGNGGAISIVGGNFTMNSTSTTKPALITKNAAFGSGVKGNGGGIYVAPASNSSAASIKVKLTKGGITSNSADRNGGGVCVDMGSNSTATLGVTVGSASEGDATSDMLISGNGAMIKGGGMYVNGASASVTLNDGNVLGNETSSYQVNPDMSVDGGVVTLMKPGITTQVTVTFNNNAQYFDQGGKSDKEVTQYLVAGANSVLKTYDEIKESDADNWSQINSYYDVFKAWNTRRDGKGTLPPFVDKDKTMVSLSEDLILYAQWE